MERRARRMEMSPGSDGSILDFEELEMLEENLGAMMSGQLVSGDEVRADELARLEEQLASGDTITEQKALCALAAVTEGVKRIESKQIDSDSEDPPGLRVDSDSDDPPELNDSDDEENVPGLEDIMLSKKQLQRRKVRLEKEEAEKSRAAEAAQEEKDEPEYDNLSKPVMVAAREETVKNRGTTQAARKAGPRRLRMVRGMTVDSGAADNVIPRRMVKGRKNKIRPSPGSRRGVHYVSASNERIPNEGECDFNFTTQDGQEQNYTFQIAEVNKALCAVSYLVDQGNQVIFDQDEATGMDTSRIINKRTGKIIQLVRDRNVWTIDAYVDDETNESSGFHRRG
jgi:hypothetical protein